MSKELSLDNSYVISKENKIKLFYYVKINKFINEELYEQAKEMSEEDLNIFLGIENNNNQEVQIKIDGSSLVGVLNNQTKKTEAAKSTCDINITGRCPLKINPPNCLSCSMM